MLGVGASGPVGADELAAAPLASASAEAEVAPAISAGQRSEERDAWAVIAGVYGVGPVGFSALLHRYGTGLAILREASSPGGVRRIATVTYGDADPDNGRRHRGIDLGVAEAIAEGARQSGRTLARIRELGLKIVTVDDEHYPLRLASVDMPPHVLFVLGDPGAMSAKAAVAIVGTRRATEAGRAIAARLAVNLVGVGASVVSGLAVGIDGAAHSAAVHARGTTVAVIGSGHAVLHPRAHSRLAGAIVGAGGAVVSELTPDTRPSLGTYPRRNRIISGLADATVVVEAPARSGALITASWALDQGRDCFLVPGSIDAPASAGCLAFLREFPDRAPDRGRHPAADRRSRPRRSARRASRFDGHRGHAQWGWVRPPDGSGASSSWGGRPSMNSWP